MDKKEGKRADFTTATGLHTDKSHPPISLSKNLYIQEKFAMLVVVFFFCSKI